MIREVACIVFASVCANHLGFVGAIESVIRRKLPVINCGKCLSFWCTLIYCGIVGVDVVPMLATSFFAAYAALWTELIMGVIDKLFGKIYDTLYPTEGAENVSDSSD